LYNSPTTGCKDHGRITKNTHAKVTSQQSWGPQLTTNFKRSYTAVI